MLSSEWATIVKDALQVDKELKPKLVSKTLSVSGSLLIAEFSAVDTRNLRNSVNGFYDYLVLSMQTLKEFGCTQ
uniref:Globin family profile domain-containing protein n=1 Tax=Arcella intermedia TaxID=1963864 RepID=A0A6B2LWI3_9EUKA